MIRRFCSVILLLFLAVSLPVSAAASDETAFTLTVPDGLQTNDSVVIAIGYTLAEACDGLAGYAVKVTWDPTLLALNTDYREDMTDKEMANCTGCLFSDPYHTGLPVADSGTYIVNYRNVHKGELTVVSIAAANKSDREAVLFFLQFLPLAYNADAVVTVSVDPSVGLTSASGLIPDYRAETKLTVRLNIGLLFCDADGNGKVEDADRALVKKYARYKFHIPADMPYTADVNADGTVDGTDYLLVCRELQK